MPNTPNDGPESWSQQTLAEQVNTGYLELSFHNHEQMEVQDNPLTVLDRYQDKGLGENPVTESALEETARKLNEGLERFRQENLASAERIQHTLGAVFQHIGIGIVAAEVQVEGLEHGDIGERLDVTLIDAGDFAIFLGTTDPALLAVPIGSEEEPPLAGVALLCGDVLEYLEQQRLKNPDQYMEVVHILAPAYKRQGLKFAYQIPENP